MTTPSPPPEFQTQIDYAIVTMDARGSQLDHMLGKHDMPTQDAIRAAPKKNWIISD
jgi:hypothetical protein